MTGALADAGCATASTGAVPPQGGTLVGVRLGDRDVADRVVGQRGDEQVVQAGSLADRQADFDEDVARQALGIAADICIYTNANLTVETLELDASAK